MTTDDPLLKLEDAQVRQRVDPSGFHRLLERLPEQAREAWRMGLAADLGATPKRPSRVLLVGLGGSAIGADVAATVATDLSTTPVQVIRNYHLPPLDQDTLVILCSFSGNTEETLAAFDAVAEAGARGIAITTGGVLKSRALAAGMPTFSYDWPGPPRTGLGYSVFILLGILRRLEVIAIDDAEIEGGFGALDRATAAYAVESDANRAKTIGAWLHGGVPAIIGADMLEVAARRWAGEISENAKQVSAAYGIPEFNHNQLEAAARAGAEVGPLRFVILDAPVVHPRNRLRVTQTAEMMLAAGRQVQIANAGGNTPIEAILGACALGSWTSYYLGLLRDEDPAPMTVMDRLKRVLAQER
ncbi:MAG: SIS domain-containing protein [Dehalococcoidia bacterium]|nr:SIS domain-containing protein [Dehalococcoidia bacterium]